MPPPSRAPLPTARLLAALVTLLASVAARPCPAQPGTAPAAGADSARTDPLCWRGRPLPRCRTFLLFELGYHAPVVRTGFREVLREGGGGIGGVERREPDFSWQFVWAAGAMRNLDARTAVGGTVLVGATGYGDILGAQARYRRWTGRRTSAELGAGPIVTRVPQSFAVTSPPPSDRRSLGVAVDGRLNFADRVAGGVRLVAVPGGGRLRGAVLAGGNTGSGVAVAGTVVTGALIGALIVLFLTNGYD